jgi:hypothetical protein
MSYLTRIIITTAHVVQVWDLDSGARLRTLPTGGIGGYCPVLATYADAGDGLPRLVTS